MTTSRLKGQLDAFARTISKEPMGLAHHVPEPWAKPTRCFENAAAKVRESGGRVRFGWMFHFRQVLQLGGAGYLIAVHHAVWHAPNGALVDVTPFDPDPLHRPLTPAGNDDILFLLDSSAVPIQTANVVAPRPSKFYPVSDDERLIAHIQRLQAEEDQNCQRIYGGDGEVSSPT
ncbi:MAG TPA: hypothetical protein VFA81_07690 [Burkholderiales bacterium]|nr:hypothetical protein [Burkholderiales bacterium]